MEGEIRELLGTIQEPHLRTLLERVFGEDGELWAGYRTAPAAKYYHQAYATGCSSTASGSRRRSARSARRSPASIATWR